MLDILIGQGAIASYLETSVTTARRLAKVGLIETQSEKIGGSLVICSTKRACKKVKNLERKKMFEKLKAAETKAA